MARTAALISSRAVGIFNDRACCVLQGRVAYIPSTGASVRARYLRGRGTAGHGRIADEDLFN